MRRYLIDTAIWIDAYEDRVGYAGEPLGEYAWKLLAHIRAAEQVIVLTELHIIELERRYTLEQINSLFSVLGVSIEKILASEQQHKQAKKLSLERNVPRGDALLAVLARDESLILVSRDNHFRLLHDVARCHKPEELI